MCKSKSLSESDTEIYTQDYMLHIRKEEKALLKKMVLFFLPMNKFKTGDAY